MGFYYYSFNKDGVRLMSIKHLAANILCGFIPDKKIRHRVRVRAYFDISKYIEFAKANAGRPNASVRTYQGHGGMKKIIVVLDNAVAYKFPLVAARADSPRREKMFTDAFRDASPIRLPKMDVLKFNGMDVLKYEFISGRTLADTPSRVIRRHGDKIAKQLAKFIFEIGRSNPPALRKLRPPRARPGYMYGWYHGDIAGNFVIDQNTGDISAVIDWESAAFCDMRPDIMAAFKFMEKRAAADVILKAVIEYGKLYSQI